MKTKVLVKQSKKESRRKFHLNMVMRKVLLVLLTGDSSSAESRRVGRNQGTFQAEGSPSCDSME